MFSVGQGTAAGSDCPSSPLAPLGLKTIKDPIFAVIEAHRRSCAETLAAISVKAKSKMSSWPYSECRLCTVRLRR